MKTALIVGASGTLGSAIARELFARGYRVGLHYHKRKNVCEKLAVELSDSGLPSPLVGEPHSALQNGGVRGAVCYAADFLDAAAPQALATAFIKDFQSVDALIWAAGIVKDAPLLTLKEDDLRAVLNVDLKAFFLLLKAFSRQFIKQKSGAVVALSSHAAVAGRAGGAAYAMAQSGMLSLVKSTAREWGGLGIRVNAVLPPFVAESAMGKAASPEFIDAVKAKRVLKVESDGALACAQLVASVVENAAISGQVLSADSRVL
jgi:3-oxoacyl-[acyl-carrier protein] reductase